MTVPKNTNLAKYAIANAHDVKVYSLSNNFSGEPLSDKPVVWGGPIIDGRYRDLIEVSVPEFMARELKSRHAKLTLACYGRYHLHIHSNLWYNFAA